jgi:hypothetical protein
MKTLLWIAFLLGFVFGAGLNLLLNILFWGLLGLGLVLLFDAAAGLSQRACSLRMSVREWLVRRMSRARPAPVYRKHIWVNI